MRLQVCEHSGRLHSGMRRVIVAYVLTRSTVQAMRNLKRQNAAKETRPALKTEASARATFSRSASMPTVARPQWGISGVADAREGAKMSLTSIMENLQADHPDLAAALEHLHWAAKDLGMEKEHTFKRAESAAQAPPMGVFTRAMSIAGERVEECHEEEEEEEMSLEDMTKDMQASGQGAQEASGEQAAGS